jgi:hypothetical protein
MSLALQFFKTVFQSQTMCLVENMFSKTKTFVLKIRMWPYILNPAPIPAVAEPPKLLGPHASVLVSKTSDGYACAPDNLTWSVRVSQWPRINHLQLGPQDKVNTNHTLTFLQQKSYYQILQVTSSFIMYMIRVIALCFECINICMFNIYASLSDHPQ